MRHVFLQRMPEGTLAKEDQPRQDLLFDRADPTLRVRMQIWRPRRERYTFHACGLNHPLKCQAEFAVSVMAQVLPGSPEAPFLHRHVARHLDHPCLIRMRCHPCHMDFSGAEPDEEKHIICRQSTPGPYLSREEVGRDEDLHMCTDTFFPGGRLVALWSGRDTMALQDVAHRLITDGVSKML